MYRIILLALASALLFALPVQAHKALFFAYMEDGQIVCEGGFPGGKSCKNCPVTMYDAATGVEIAKANTNEEGLVRMPLTPEAQGAKHGLKLVLYGGEGHQAEWLLEPEEYRDAQPAQTAVPATAPSEVAASEISASDNGQQSLQAEQKQQISDAAAAEANQAALYNVVSRAIAEQVGPIVDQRLEHKLGPLRRQMAEAMEQGPTVTSVIGGLGWIVGIAGIIAWMRSRRTV